MNALGSPATRTVVMDTYADMPAEYRSDCMAKMAPGIYWHMRLNTAFVIRNETSGFPELVLCETPSHGSQRQPRHFEETDCKWPHYAGR